MVPRVDYRKVFPEPNFDDSFHSLIAWLVRWTKLFWIDVLWENYKQSNASNFVIVLFSYHARKTCVTAYLNLCPESQKVQKIAGFLRLMVYLYILVLCTEHSYVPVRFFHEFNEMAQGRIYNPFKEHCNPVILQQFWESKIEVGMLPQRATGQTKHSYLTLLWKKIWENGTVLVDEPRNRRGNIPKSTNSNVWGSWPRTIKHSSILCNCGLCKAQAKGSHLQNRQKTDLGVRTV